MTAEIELPRVADSITEPATGPWFVLYPPDAECPVWEWRSSGGDLFLSAYDSVARVISLPVVDMSEFGLAPLECGTDDYQTWQTS